MGAPQPTVGHLEIGALVRTVPLIGRDLRGQFWKSPTGDSSRLIWKREGLLSAPWQRKLSLPGAGWQPRHLSLGPETNTKKSSHVLQGSAVPGTVLPPPPCDGIVPHSYTGRFSLILQVRKLRQRRRDTPQVPQ